MNSGRNPWSFGFKAALGAIAAVWLVRIIGGILTILIFIGFAAGWIIVPVSSLASCMSASEPQFIQDCFIDRLEIDHVKQTAHVFCKDGAQYEIDRVSPDHGPMLAVFKSKGRFYALSSAQ